MAIALRLQIPHVLLALAFVLLCLGYYRLTSWHERAMALLRWLRRGNAQRSSGDLVGSKELGH